MASQAIDNSSWSNYFEITSDNTKVANANDNLLYDLSDAPAGFWSTVKSDGGDIRATNSAGDTAYSFELENFSTGSETGILFFNSQGLSTGSDTVYRIYYGNAGASLPAASDPLGAQNVWNSNYLAVHHMNAASGNESDSTSNAHNLTEQNTVPSTSGGKIADARDFNGTNDYFDFPDNLGLDNTGFTFQAWFDTSEGVSQQRIAGFYDGADDIMFIGPENGNIRFRAGHLGGNEFNFENDTASAIGTNTLYLVHGTYDGSTATIYIDGAADGTATASIDDPFDDTEIMDVGRRSDNNQYLEGLIDELRILSTSLSSSWISTEYNNQNSPSTFWSTGAEQENGVTRRVFNIS